MELAGPPERLAECDEENQAGRGDPEGQGRGEAERPGAPLRSQPRPQAGRPGPGPGSSAPGCRGFLGFVSTSRPRGARYGRVRGTPAGQEGRQAEQAPKESSRPLPEPPRLLFEAFSPFLSHARSLSLARSLSPLET